MLTICCKQDASIFLLLLSYSAIFTSLVTLLPVCTATPHTLHTHLPLCVYTHLLFSLHVHTFFFLPYCHADLEYAITVLMYSILVYTGKYEFWYFFTAYWLHVYYMIVLGNSGGAKSLWPHTNGCRHFDALGYSLNETDFISIQR